MGLRIGEFPEEENNFLLHPVVAEGAFDKSDLTKVLEAIDLESVPKKAITLGNDDGKFIISFVPYVDDNAWVYGKLYDLALEANEQTFKFDNIEMFEHIVYMELNPGDFINSHIDLGNEFPHNSRKIAVVINLSASDDYRGGDFNIQSTVDITTSRSAGDCTFFPAYLKNEVTPVTKGKRKILVAWFGGQSFR